MAKLIENLGKNIPPKARMVLVITGVLTIAVSFFMIKTFTSSSSSSEQNISGGASLIAPPKKDQLDSSKPGEESIIPSDSPAGIQIAEDREKEIESAKLKGGGFMDKIRISNSQEVIKDLNEDSGGLLYQNIGGDIDDNLNQRDQIKEQREKLAQAKRDRANAVLENKAYQDHQKELEEQNAIEEDFLANELGKYDNNYYKEYIASDKPYTVNGSSSGYVSFTDTESSQSSYGSNGISISSSKSLTGNSTLDKYAKEVTASKPDLSRLDDYRGISDNSSSGNRNSGGGQSSSRSSSQNNSSSQSNYASLVNPLGVEKEVTSNRVSPGEMHYAILQIGINTDEIGPVRAVIPGNGTLGEAVLLGTPVKVGEKASIAFKTMTMNGKDYSISAIALDPETMRPGLADDVDRHIFERYFKLAIAAAADGYVDAISSYSTTTSDGTTETIYEALPDASDQLATAIGKVGEVLVPKFEEAFDREATITVDQNKNILIMFMTGLDIPND